MQQTRLHYITVQLSGWRRSADRTRLQAYSLLTGNFAGNFVVRGGEQRCLAGRRWLIGPGTAFSKLCPSARPAELADDNFLARIRRQQLVIEDQRPLDAVSLGMPSQIRLSISECAYLRRDTCIGDYAQDLQDQLSVIDKRL